jgi:hypothetical protein
LAQEVCLSIITLKSLNYLIFRWPHIWFFGDLPH